MTGGGIEQATFEGWVILELMGHRRLAGYLSEQQIGGASFLRIDVPSSDLCERCAGAGGLQETDLDLRPTHTEDPCTDCNGYGTKLSATQLYAPSAVYCITPTTEETARKVAGTGRVAPVQQWELPALTQGSDEQDIYCEHAP
jgi:hypothetical protein